MTGEVEVDETYSGGKRSGPRGRGASGKTIVVGMVERQGSATAKVVPDVKARTLLPMFAKHVSNGNTTIFTDELGSYNQVEKLGYTHEVV